MFEEGIKMEQKEFNKLMYEALTPWYQIASMVFIVMGIIIDSLSLLSIINQGYLIPGSVSIILGALLLKFIKSLKRRS